MPLKRPAESQLISNATKKSKVIETETDATHKAQKLILSQRRSQKPHAALLAQAKDTWSLLRQKTLSSDKRQEYVQQLTLLLLPQNKEVQLKHLILNHSFSRIIQALIKYSSSPQRDQIAHHLQGSYQALSSNRYSRFLVSKLMKLVSSDRRRKIIAEFQGSVLKLVRHKEAGKVLGDAFEIYAGECEKAVLVREFFGKEVMVLLGGRFASGGATEEEREKAKMGLRGILLGIPDPERRKKILVSTKDNLITIFNTPEKDGVTHSIVHRALWEYLSAISEASIVPSDAEQETLRREMLDASLEVLAEMVHTKDGSRVVREFLAWGTPKDRKHILKALKPHIEKICLDEGAQLVLFTALDVIDDTKLLSKTLIDPIVSSAHKLYEHTQGRRTLLYLLVPRSRRHFTPVQIASIGETDGIRERTSKKDGRVREEEIRRCASLGLIGWVESQASDVLRHASGCLVIAEIMLFAEGDKQGAIKSLLTALKPGENEEEESLIDLPPTSRLYKTLLQGGHYNHTTKQVERVVVPWDATAFAVRFVDEVGEKGVIGMCVGKEGNGTFVVAELVEALNRGFLEGERKEKEEVELARRKIKAWFGKDQVVERIERGEAKGKKVLLDKLRGM